MNSKKFLLAMIIFTALLLVVAIVYTAVIANRDGDTATSDEPTPSDEPSAPSDPTDDLTNEPITPPVSDERADSDESTGDISSPPPVTEPPVTEPPATEPPVTDPPVTQPPVTDEVTTGGGNATYPPAFGRIISQNNYKIKLIVDWEVISRNADEAKIKLTLKLLCYSLTVSPRDKYANTLTVGGKSYGFTSPRIDSGAVSKTEYLLDTVEITMPLVNGQGSVEVSATWLFNGNYAGEQIKYVTAEGIISLAVN